MKPLLALAAMLALAGCASTPPNSPSVMVLPGSGKNFDQFRFDDHECRAYAMNSSGGSTPNQVSADSGVKSAVVGTVVGAAAGAALGNAGAGAGLGLATGALAGSGAANASGRTAQQRYDVGYQQCMYAKGHQIPMARQSAPQRPHRYSSAQPPNYPPPPPRY